MNILKGLGLTLAFILGIGAIGTLTWSVLYVAVPAVQDGTDKLFGWGEYAGTEDEKQDDVVIEDETNKDETNDDENVTTSARVSFKNNQLTITIQ